MIDLTHIRQAVAEPELVDFGATLRPFLGGATQRLDRIGTRHAITVQMPPMHIESEGRQWIVRLIRAKQEGGFVEYPQVDFNVGAPGLPTISATVEGGRVLLVTGGQPGYAIREGQALNVTSNGRKFFYLSSAPIVLNASGAGSIELDVPLREETTVGDPVNLGKPIIAGRIMEDGWKWTLETNRTVGLSFRLQEIA
jgi:hypothetical protein